MLDEQRMIKRIIVTLDDEAVEKLDQRANEANVSRNALVNQIVRAYFGLPSLLKDAS